MVLFEGQKGYFSSYVHVENSNFSRCYAVFDTLPQNEVFGRRGTIFLGPYP